MHEENAIAEELQQEEILHDDELEAVQSPEATSEEASVTDEGTDEVSVEGNDPANEPPEGKETEPESGGENVGDDTPAAEETPAGEEAPAGEEIPAGEPAEQQSVETAAPNQGKPPYHERYYLRYQEGKRSTPLDLNGTRAFLQDLGFDGGELRQAREGKNCADSYRNTGKNKPNQMYCSYCGAEISGVDFYRLPDGRLRCTTCSSTVVKTKAEAEKLFQRVLANMESFFGATIDVPVSIEMVDERKLKKKIGVPLGTRDSQSILILGVAISKKKQYSVILENGAPRISLIATFAHEMTHIWQYTHWDNKKKFKKCPKNKRLLIYEGMAKWAEIQYLYLVGETSVAKREEAITRNRQDEYGIGFCMYEDQYPLSREAMMCDSTPFTPDNYPIE